MIRFLKFMVAFLALNYFSGRTNIKHMMQQAIDISLVIKQVSQDGVISPEDKDAIVQEIIEFSDSVINFLDNIELPKKKEWGN